MDKVIASLNIKIQKKFYRTDSTIVLTWTGSPSEKWQVFVANRVSEIYNKSLPSEWLHVRSKYNTADLIFRGTMPQQLIQIKS